MFAVPSFATCHTVFFVNCTAGAIGKPGTVALMWSIRKFTFLETGLQFRALPYARNGNDWQTRKIATRDGSYKHMYFMLIELLTIN